VTQVVQCYAVAYYPKLLTPLLCHSAIKEEGVYVGGWVGAWRHLGYGVPELPPDYSYLYPQLSLYPASLLASQMVSMNWVTFKVTGFENRLSGGVCS
jgi:hypothetical protein